MTYNYKYNGVDTYDIAYVSCDYLFFGLTLGYKVWHSATYYLPRKQYPYSSPIHIQMDEYNTYQIERERHAHSHTRESKKSTYQKKKKKRSS
jgi:hypothetical protein